MKERIEKPKVFISYAWGSKDYQNLVLSLASQLIGDGIDVVIDKWNLSEGNDTNAFMEKCVNDPSITNVLILLDPLYAKKADDHIGGVGTETQIISAKVYNEVEQDRFIPIILKRDDKGNICKPTYLQGRLHFDLSLEESFDDNYKKLVKTLYGVEIYVKPKLGEKPAWVYQPLRISPQSIAAYNSLKLTQNENHRKVLFLEYLDQIKKTIIEFSNKQTSENIKKSEYIALYSETEYIRNNYLQLLQYSIYTDESYKLIATFFEEAKNGLNVNYNPTKEIMSIRIHEMFIYTVSYFIKTKKYDYIGYILGRTYFNKDVSTNNGATSFRMLYSGSSHSNLDDAIKDRDNKQYYTGTGQCWIDSLNIDFCSKEQFVFADLIIFNYSVYGKNYIGGNAWFPITYVYDNEYSGAIHDMARKMISEERVKEYLPIFGYENIDSLKSKFKEIETNQSKVYRDVRYSSSFYSAPIFSYFIKSEIIASMP